MIAIVTWVWQGERYYGPEHVNMLGAMLRRHMTVPFRLVAIADDTAGFDSSIDVMRTPPAAARLARLRTPEGQNFPSSYRRLWLFSEEARAIGPRVLMTDVDVVVIKDWAPLLGIDADFVGWQPGQSWGNTKRRIAGGMWLLKTGTKRAVWDEFCGQPSIAQAREAGFRGSDQAWISFKLVDKVPIWPNGSGIYSIRDMTRPNRTVRKDRPPKDARVIHFNNGVNGKPWDEAARRKHRWIEQYWHA